MTSRQRLLLYLFVVSLAAWTIALLVPIPKKSAEVLGSEWNKYIIAKCLHALAYTYLTVLGGMLIRTPRQGWIILGIVSGHAFLSEFLQQFVNRGASWRDVGIDHVGIVVGLVAGRRFWKGVLTPRTADPLGPEGAAVNSQG